jgi:CO/xanthine dehydrogenase Mo-binding subunit
MIAGTKRHPAIIRVKTAASRDGRILANKIEIVYDKGAYTALGPAVLDVAVENCNGPYRVEASQIDAYSVYTNNMVSSAFRGFGAPQVIFAIERQMDLVAKRLGMDPLELRLRNALRKGDRYVFGNVMQGSVGIAQCLEVARSHPLWRNRNSKRVGEWPWLRRGVGVAAAIKGYTIGALPDKGVIALELLRDGKVLVKGSFTEIGQGVVQAVAQMAADLLGVRIEDVEVVFADTEVTPDTSVTSASRQVFLAGNALRKAVEALKERVAELEERLRGRRPADVRFSGGWVLVDSERRYTIGECARLLDSFGLGRQVTGVYEVPRVEPIPGTLEIPHLFYMFGVTLAEVVVNVLTGEVNVTKVVSIVDAGKVINPVTFTGQVEGAVAQGIGYALMEEAKIEGGYLLTRDLSTYLIPSSKDVPEIEVIPVETEEPEGPFGAKGIGEIGIISVAPAILNAVADATGVEPNTIPLTHERLYWLLKEHGLVEELRGSGS